MKGIYKIENLINEKVYIGESMDIERRWEKHKIDLENNNHHSYKLQKDWNQYGKNYFKFEVLEEIQDNLKSTIQMLILIALEDKYIKKYNSLINGYNVEDTLQNILDGKRGVFQDDKTDITHTNMLKNTIINLEKNNGVYVIKEKSKKKSNEIDNNLISCPNFIEKLINEKYNINFSSYAIFDTLKERKVFYFKGGSYFVYTKYIRDGYFVNGKSSKNKKGSRRFKILITEKGQEFIIQLLELKLLKEI